MQEGRRAMLKATGEAVVIISSVGDRRYLVQLPPQQAWHKPRYQEIRDDRLQFSSQ
ncbi:MAG: hypothetical protein U5L08_00080 [Xanthomonadales bacterium]|nr:hypothetical protein [Xanthomonadales bacterium]